VMICFMRNGQRATSPPGAGAKLLCQHSLRSTRLTYQRFAGFSVRRAAANSLLHRLAAKLADNSDKAIRNSMAYVEKRRDKWRARYRQPDGKERSKTFDRKIDAKRFASSAEASIFNGTYVDPHRGKITLKEWSTVWEESLGGLRPSTRSRDL
jgi:hypothetical protein